MLMVSQQQQVSHNADGVLQQVSHNADGVVATG